MIYKYEEYAAANPKRPLQVLNKFKDTKKNLHEMSIDEINSVVSSWDALVPGSVFNQKSAIKNYFVWLNANGVSVDPEIVKDIKFPLKKEVYLIYSTEDIKYYWDLILKNAEKFSIKYNEPFNSQFYWMCQAVGILSFYGMNAQEILNLTLSDVQPNGVLGYDLPLTKEDIDILLRYKNLKEYSGSQRLIGYKYIRSTKSDEISNKVYLNYSLVRIKCDEEYNYIKTLLTDSNLYKLGLYNRLFEYEIRNKVKLEINTKTPEWFTRIVGKCSEGKLTKLRKEFNEYRFERFEKKADSIHQIVDEDKSKSSSVVNDNVSNDILDYAVLEEQIDHALSKAIETVEELKAIKQMLAKFQTKNIDNI